jgi:FtsP/CotA-like multicopper oxidase with cupredoxin domain
MFLILLILLNYVTAKVHIFNWTLSQGIRNPDGVYKLVYLINGKFPLPTIEVDYGDWIDLTLSNKLYMETTSIHWHGINMDNSPWMDGVPYVTQYPILPMQSFRYHFQVLQSGTYWYHSHVGTQYSDGLYGPLVIHDLSDSYDIANNNSKIGGETILTIGDWYHQSSSKQIGILKEMGFPWSFPPYTNVLWNGKGFFDCNKYNNYNNIFETRGNIYNCQTLNYPRFYIKNNLPLRFRIINSSSGLTLVFSIDYHNLVVIAIDGVPIKHFETKRILIYVGQRYDILIYPISIDISDFWIRTNTLDYPVGETEQSLGILSYNNSTNIPQTIAWDINSKNLSNLETNLILGDNVPKISEIDDFLTVTLNINCSYTEYLCTINDIKYKPDFMPIILQKYNNIETTNPSIIKLPYKKYIKLIINSRDMKSHPYHKHGSNFWILGIGKPGEGHYHKQRLNTINPLYRDTIQINAYSWMVLLFYTDTPGAWFSHCHIAVAHENSGMDVIFLVDEKIQDPPSEYHIITNYNDFNSKTTTVEKIIDLDRGSVIFLGVIFTVFGGILIYLAFLKRKKKWGNYARM